MPAASSVDRRTVLRAGALGAVSLGAVAAAGGCAWQGAAPRRRW